MKNLFILLAFPLTMSTWSHAQASSTPQGISTPRTEEYCEIRFIGKFLSRHKVVARIDFGNGDEILKDEAGKDVEFPSVVAALNYMNGQGWKLVDIHARMNEGDSHTYYVMKRSLE